MHSTDIHCDSLTLVAAQLWKEKHYTILPTSTASKPVSFLLRVKCRLTHQLCDTHGEKKYPFRKALVSSQQRSIYSELSLLQTYRRSTCAAVPLGAEGDFRALLPVVKALGGKGLCQRGCRTPRWGTAWLAAVPRPAYSLQVLQWCWMLGLSPCHRT